MKLPRIAVRRPVTVIMFVMVLLLLGAISLGRLPLDLLPDIEAPVIAIQTSYDDAGPYEVENFVTRPVEEAVATVDHVSTISSVSSQGHSTVVAQFDWGTDMDFAALDVRERVDLVSDALPDDTGSPTIIQFDPADMPIMELVVTGEASLAALRHAADDTVESELERIEGVASVSVAGGRRREVQVDLHPGLMQTHRLPMERIGQILAAENINMPAGTVTDRNLSHVVRTMGEYDSVDAIGRQRIPNDGGALVPLSQVAEVIDGHEEAEQLGRFQGEPSVLLSVQKEAAANSVDVAERIEEALPDINDQLETGVSVAVVQDLTVFIQDSVRDVTINAVVGGVLAMFVLLTFLRSFRPTLIVAFAIPVSVVTTFILMYFSDTSINMISLGGLALGIGMLVDNAIVVLENVFRHKEQGWDAQQSAQQGAEEVGTAITASTLTTVSVFLPVVFIAGIAAEIFRDMALTVTFSLATSLVISLSLIPMLASKVLPHGQITEIRRLRSVGFLMERAQTVYGGVISKIIERRKITGAVALVLFVTAAALAPMIGMEFLPDFDQGEIQVDVQMPRGTKLEDTDAVIGQIEQYALEVPEVDVVFSSVGDTDGEGMDDGLSSDVGRVGIVLEPRADRERDTEKIARKLRSHSQGIPGADVSVTMTDMAGAFFGDPVQLELQGDTMEELESAADDVLEGIEQVPGIVDAGTSLEDREPEIQLEVNRDRAAEYGLTVTELGSVLRTAVAGDAVTTYRTGGQEIDVSMQLAEEWRSDPDALLDVPIDTERGVIPFGEVADITFDTSPVNVERTDRTRTVTVFSGLVDRDLSAAMEDVETVVAGLDLPHGVSAEVAGESEEMLDAFEQLSLAMVLGVLLVYMILASQFESLLQPVIIMFTLPLALIGVVGGLLLVGATFSVVAFVGAIMLAGIVVNNAIVYVDYINQLRRQGSERNEAVRKAGEVRMRPILMTSLTTILAMVPLAIGIGEGQEMQRPIAVVVIGGLAASTFLALLVIPASYTVVDDAEQWILSRLGRKKEENARDV